ncbi:MAG: Mth938-like domain-containing protein [Planctomycetota bacterium]
MIESYSFGRAVIDGRAYTSDLLLLPSAVRPGWRRREGHSLCVEDLEEVLADPPEVLVIGRGQPGMMRVPDEVRAALESRGIEVVDLPTAEAVEAFNGVSGQRRAVAALHLTC